MILLIAFAFLAGIVTILSPCILPILPIVLSGSLGGGRRRPLGVVTGFVASFTIFTLFLSAIVKAFGVSADWLRTFSIIVIGLFGLSLLIPQTQLTLEKIFSRLSGFIPQGRERSGFGGGLVIGLSLGLLWTPCVGPILASVISLALSGSVTGSAFFITLAYALGTAIPLLAIVVGGRRLINKNPWLTSRTATIQKAFGVIMIVLAVAIFLNLDRKFQAYIITKFPRYGAGLTHFEDNSAVRKQLEGIKVKTDNSIVGKPMNINSQDFGAAPEIIPGGKWFNSPPITIKSLRGKVVLIDFWTYTCINCIRTLPYIRNWNTKYKDHGLVIIGIHTPEFEFEKDSNNVGQAISDFKLTYPIVQDNNYATWGAYDNHYWPAKYLIDKDGKVRYTHFGEGDYDTTEQVIQDLLKEKGAKITNKIQNSEYQVDTQTPETYLGYSRLQAIIPTQRVARDKSANYSNEFSIPANNFALTGQWMIASEYARPDSKARLEMNFTARHIYLVMRPKNKGQVGRVKVYLDDKVVTTEAGEDVKDGIVTVNDDRLYTLINQDSGKQGILKLEFLDGNLELFAFTFG